MMKRYRSFEEVYPDAEFDVEKAFRDWMEENELSEGYGVPYRLTFTAGWEAAEKKLMSVEEEQ